MSMRFETENIAKVCHEANRAYNEILGDFSVKPWQYASDQQKKSVESGVAAIIDGTVKSARESHEAWLRYKAAEGWAYGPDKDEKAKLHPCFMPWEKLPLVERRKDEMFFGIVRALTGAMDAEGV